MTFLDDVHCRLAVGDNGRRAMDESDLTCTEKRSEFGWIAGFQL
jgi:hypothetical protein